MISKDKENKRFCEHKRTESRFVVIAVTYGGNYIRFYGCVYSLLNKEIRTYQDEGTSRKKKSY